MEKQTVLTILRTKGNRKLTMITAYDALFAKLFDNEVDIILVGDSLNMSFAGQKDTLSVGMEQMLYHTKAVCNGAKNTFVICDMPFGTYTNEMIALKNAMSVYHKTEADAVKIEGGVEKAHIIKYLTQNSIAVIGHIGLLPQNVRADGGYRIQGKTNEDINRLIKDAKAVEQAGAFAIVLEGVTSQAGAIITKSVNIPIIGIGAGNNTDGQVLVWSDMFGFFEDFKPKFVRQYINGASIIKNNIKQYVKDVSDQSFPSIQEQY